MNFIYNNKQIYSDKYYLYLYNENNFRIVYLKNSRNKGFEEIKDYIDFIGTAEDNTILSYESERCSLSRTKRHIREISLCNNFTHFATLTINSSNCDRYSLEKCQDLLKKHLRRSKDQARRKNIDFAYIFITEKHKDGAFHFHGLVKGLEFYTNNNGYLSNKVFDEIGFNSFSPIKDYNKTCNYITKYITKDCIKNSHNQIYISSRGLKKAERYQIQPLEINWKYENDFCKIADFNINELTQEEKLKFLQIKEGV